MAGPDYRAEAPLIDAAATTLIPARIAEDVEPIDALASVSGLHVATLDAAGITDKDQ